ncbi:MAG: LysM peptidoglycan-binding domain-containing protein [Alphaproteobacteria bacterium]|nr:LysM peptidoglycan-binding domain-containing protein [Alphaproteobacteria bacterium]
MSTIGTLNIAGFGAVGAAFFILAAPASAGRCGHSYAVDAPTTLVTVARQCNVNLSALYEANPGVDPSNVRPGEYLAVPDEITGSTLSVADAPLAQPSAVQPAVTDSQAHGVSGTIINDAGRAGMGGDFSGVTQRISYRDQWGSSSSRSAWRREESLGARQHANSDTLSYQRLSALRIESAGLPTAPARFAGANSSAGVQLIECQVLRKRDGGKIHKLRKIISTPENTFVEISAMSEGEGSDCRLISASAPVRLTPGVPAAHYTTPTADTGYRLPDYSKIGDIVVTPRLVQRRKISLRGEIVDSTNGCLLLKTDNDVLRRLSTTQPADDLLGKEVTVWGTMSSNGACGGGASILISHAVYAERWPAR